MEFEEIRAGIRAQDESGALFERAKNCACEYMDGLDRGRVYPDGAALAALAAFDEPLGDAPSDPLEMLEALHSVGSKAAVAQSGGR